MTSCLSQIQMPWKTLESRKSWTKKIIQAASPARLVRHSGGKMWGRPRINLCQPNTIRDLSLSRNKRLRCQRSQKRSLTKERKSNTNYLSISTSNYVTAWLTSLTKATMNQSEIQFQGSWSAILPAKRACSQSRETTSALFQIEQTTANIRDRRRRSE